MDCVFYFFYTLKLLQFKSLIVSVLMCFWGFALSFESFPKVITEWNTFVFITIFFQCFYFIVSWMFKLNSKYGTTDVGLFSSKCLHLINTNTSWTLVWYFVFFFAFSGSLNYLYLSNGAIYLQFISVVCLTMCA